jgi:hypothetical protein
MPSLAHITGTAYAATSSSSSLVYAPANTQLTLTPVSVTGQAIYSGNARTRVGASGAVDFYAIRGAQITISGSIKGFEAPGATVQIPDAADVTFEELVAITVTPATFGNPMTTAGDLIVGGVSGAAQRLAKGSNGQVLTVTAGVLGWADAGFGSGSVTSVGLSLPNIFTVSNSPVTTTGTLTGTLANQNANLVFAGPGTGSAAAPSFRSLVAGDIPDLSATYQPLSTNLTTYAGIAPSANVQTLLGAASFAAFRTSLGVAIGSNVQAWDADLDAIAALAGTSGLLQKTGANTWSLDTSTYATQAYANALVVGLLDDRGNYDASGNAFPSSGGSGSAGAILKGDLWTVSVAGTLGGTAVTAGDVVRALADSPGQTASNWAIGENNFGYVALNQALADGKIYVGNASGIGTAVTPSGDVTITNAGVFAIGSAKVTNAMLAGSIAYSKLSLTGAVLNADLAGSIAYSKLSLTGAILNADLAGSIAASKLVGTDIATVGTITSGGLGTGAVIGGVTMTLGSDASGDVYYRNSSGVLTRVAAGAQNTVFTMGASSVPSWQAAGGGANTALGNLASVSINASLIPQTTLDLGAAATPWRDLYLYGSGTFGSHSIKLTGTPTGNRVLTLPNVTDTVAVLGTAQTFTAAQTYGSNLLLATSPKITTGIADANGNSMLAFTATASAVNGFGFTNSVTGTGLAATRVEIQPSGSDANISLSLLPKGTSSATQSRILFGANGGFTLWGDGDWQLGNNAGTSWSRLRFADAFSLSRGGTDSLLIQTANAGATMATIDQTGVVTRAAEGSTGGIKVAFTIISTTDNVATITATNLIPAGCLLLGVTTRVRTALGTSHSLSSVSIGDGTTANLFSNNSGITSGTTTDLTNHLSTFAPKLYTAAGNVVVTANGGNFDATGQFRITVYYIPITAPTS